MRRGDTIITSTDVIMHLQDIRDFIGPQETDVRLQVLDDGNWGVHYGDACYDTESRYMSDWEMFRFVESHYSGGWCNFHNRRIK